MDDPDITQQFTDIDKLLKPNNDRDVQQYLHELSVRLDLVEQQVSEKTLFDDLFVAGMSGSAWVTLLPNGGTNNTFSAGDIASGTTGAYAAITLGAGQAMLLRVRADDQDKYVLVGGGVLMNGGSITGHTGTGPTNFNPYQVTFLDGTTGNAYNAIEPFDGSPGSLGVNVGTDGSLGSCLVAAIGTTPSGGLVPFIWDPIHSRWAFAIANSAG